MTSLDVAQLTARVALSTFSVAFAAERADWSWSTRRALYRAFVVSQAVHLTAVAAHFWALGRGPGWDPTLGLLLVGVVAALTIARAAWSASGSRLAPRWATWFLWLLFAGTHVLRLLETGRPRLLHAALLALVLAAAIARLWFGRTSGAARDAGSLNPS